MALRPLCLGALVPVGLVGALLGALLAVASAAHADDLIVSVERTAGTTDRPALTVRSTEKGRVGVSVKRVRQVQRWFEVARDLARPEGVEAALSAYEARAGNAAGQVADLVNVATRELPYEAGNVRERVEFDPLGPGLYLVEVAQGTLRAHALLLVSDLALVTKRDARGLLVWAVDRASGAPRAGVNVGTTDAAGAPLAALTDANGLVRFEARFLPEVRLLARRDEHWACGGERWFPADVPARRVYLVAHQPAYRPGERVEVRGVVRGVDGDGRPVLDAAVTTAKLTFIGPGEKVLGKQDVAVSDLGTFAGGLDLPKDAPTGECEVRAEIDGREHAAPFLVDAYRAPPFEVRAAAASLRVPAGAQVKFHVTAAGFDGSRLPGAPVTWSLVHHRVERELFDSDEFARLFFGTEREAFAPVTLATGAGKLDAESALDVEAATPATLADGYVTLLVTVVGPGGLHVAGSGVCGLSAAPLVVAVKTDRHLYGPEDQAHVTVRAEQADGKPAANRAGRLAPTLLRNLSAFGSRVTVPLTPVPFTTDARGEARFDVSLPEAGRYELVAAVDRAPGEPAGEPVKAEAAVWVVGETTSLGYAGDRLDVIADKDDYAVGETARLLVLCPWAKRPLLATLEGGTLLDARVLTPAGDALLFTVALTDAHVPNVWASFLGVDRGNLVTGSRLLRLPPVTRRLAIAVTPDKPELPPGATSGATLEVQDSAGRPVANAEVSLAVVDEALHSLFPETGVAIEAFFHPLRRNSVATGGPLHLASLGRAHKDLPLRTKGSIPMPEGITPPSAPAPSPVPMPAEAPRPGTDPAAPAGGRAPLRARLGEGADRVSDEEHPLFGSEAEEKAVEVRESPSKPRSDFRTCVFWTAALRTGADGRVRAEGIRYADSLTRWRLTAIGVDAATRVGTGTAEVRTKKELAIEVTLPRFLRVGDRVDAPVLVTNLTAAEVEGGGWAHWSMGKMIDEGGRQPVLRLPPGVATRNGTLDIKPTAPGTVHVLARADAGPLTDTLERSLPVLPQGIETATGVYVEAQPVEGGVSRAAVELALPKDLDRATLRVRLSVEPTVFSAVARALPYLVDYPHGCTEQTLSRFEPLIVSAEAAEALGIPAKGVLAEVPKMVTAGIERLAALQHHDGGFGWWPNDESNVEMTIRAVRALGRVDKFPDVAPTATRLKERALGFLEQVVDTKALGQEFARLALVAAGSAAEPEMRALESLHLGLGQEVKTGALLRADFLEAELAAGRKDLAEEMVKALLALAVRDGTGIHFGPRDAVSVPEVRREDAIESTAVALLALWKAGVRGAEIDSGVRWLLAHRVGGEVWRSTRDTAAAVAFLAAYAREHGLAAEEAQFFHISGTKGLMTSWNVSRAMLLQEFGDLELARVLTGEGRIAVTVEGPGMFGVNLSVSGFATGPAIAKREAGFHVERRFFRLDPVTADGRVTYSRTPVTETVPAGARLECEVIVTTDRPREYVQVTSDYAAGFEPEREVAVAVPGRARATPSEVERFDDRVEFFVTRMPAGTHVFHHLVRATHAGAFTVLPARARLMYFPEVSGSSTGEALEVTAAPAGGGK